MQQPGQRGDWLGFVLDVCTGTFSAQSEDLTSDMCSLFKVQMYALSSAMARVRTRDCYVRKTGSDSLWFPT